jgi:hypothetical protein
MWLWLGRPAKHLRRPAQIQQRFDTWLAASRRWEPVNVLGSCVSGECTRVRSGACLCCKVWAGAQYGTVCWELQFPAHSCCSGARMLCCASAVPLPAWAWSDTADIMKSTSDRSACIHRCPTPGCVIVTESVESDAKCCCRLRNARQSGSTVPFFVR